MLNNFFSHNNYFYLSFKFKNVKMGNTIQLPPDWYKLSRELQVDFIVENKLFDETISVNELKAWCERHAFEKDIKDAILNKNLNWKFSFTGRWVIALMSIWHLHTTETMEYCHYRRNIMPEIIKEFKKNYDITNIATLGRKPYELITAADKQRLGEDYDCDGMWQLNPFGYSVLKIKNNIKIPKKVLFSTINENVFQIVGNKYILWNEAPRLNLKETLKILKTW